MQKGATSTLAFVNIVVASNIFSFFKKKKEALRLRPAHPGLERVTLTDATIGSYIIPKRTSVYMSIFSSCFKRLQN